MWLQCQCNVGRSCGGCRGWRVWLSACMSGVRRFVAHYAETKVKKNGKRVNITKFSTARRRLIDSYPERACPTVVVRGWQIAINQQSHFIYDHHGIIMASWTAHGAGGQKPINGSAAAGGMQEVPPHPALGRGSNSGRGGQGSGGPGMRAHPVSTCAALAAVWAAQNWLAAYHPS